MPENYLGRVRGMLGEPPKRYADAAAWRTLESDLEVSLPADFKEIVDDYAPIQINGHLWLHHPATERWNLGEWIRSTSEAWSQIDWDSAEADGDPRILLGTPDLLFGTAAGLIPITSTDRGETIFYAPRGATGKGALFIEDGDGEFFAYAMEFAEWLYRWLIGEDMTGPGGSAFYPGPVALQDLPMTPDDRPMERSGPDRGM
ncbi:SMI1/KNR4 family protein [Streptomyces sp. NPDC059002]|uniref:SMI1/KNR4 family protein n=1 Tax=Streptomyces sp. NPDC059002 TaxID=3346690 RepID=UPI0036AF35E8